MRNDLEYLDTGELGDSAKIEMIGLSYEDLVSILGKPNAIDDPYKVKYSWALLHKPTNTKLFIWDYKGSYKNNTWSLCGGTAELWETLLPKARIYGLYK